jgi:hypothetical protein
VSLELSMGHSQSSGPVLERAWPTPEVTPARKPVREAERPDPRFGRRSVNASIRPASPRESQREDRAAGGPSSIGRSLRRALFRFLLAVLVGVGGTLGWQSYGEQMLAAHAPTLAWLFSISASKPPSAAATASDTTQVAPPASNLDEVRRPAAATWTTEGPAVGDAVTSPAAGYGTGRALTRRPIAVLISP